MYDFPNSFWEDSHSVLTCLRQFDVCSVSFLKRTKTRIEIPAKPLKLDIRTLPTNHKMLFLKLVVMSCFAATLATTEETSVMNEVAAPTSENTDLLSSCDNCPPDSCDSISEVLHPTPDNPTLPISILGLPPEPGQRDTANENPPQNTDHEAKEAKEVQCGRLWQGNPSNSAFPYRLPTSIVISIIASS